MDYYGEDRVCQLNVTLEQQGLDRWLTIDDVTYDCMYISACGVRAGISNSCLANVRSRPSFDCRKAGTVIEQLICSDVMLGELDAELGQYYRGLHSALDNDDAAILRSYQQEWLRQKRNSCQQTVEPVACLAKVYQRRRWYWDLVWCESGYSHEPALFMRL